MMKQYHHQHKQNSITKKVCNGKLVRHAFYVVTSTAQKIRFMIYCNRNDDAILVELHTHTQLSSVLIHTSKR